MNIGISRDKAEFAVESIRRRWKRMGQPPYPQATELLITADGGGSNGYRTRLWKRELQQLTFHIFAALAEFERDILRQRVNAGLKAARRRRRLGGRPKSLTEADLKKARALLRSGDYTKGQVAEELKVGRHTLWRALLLEATK